MDETADTTDLDDRDICMHCDLPVARGLFGWMNIYEPTWKDRMHYVCVLSPTGYHRVPTIEDIRTDMILMELELR